MLESWPTFDKVVEAKLTLFSNSDPNTDRQNKTSELNYKKDLCALSTSHHLVEAGPSCEHAADGEALYYTFSVGHTVDGRCFDVTLYGRRCLTKLLVLRQLGYVVSFSNTMTTHKHCSLISVHPCRKWPWHRDDPRMWSGYTSSILCR